jgi:integrase
MKKGRAKGTVVTTKSGLLQGIITLADGRRHRLEPFPKGTSRAMAEERTAWATEHRDELEVPAAPKVTIEAHDADTSAGGVWFKAWLADRLARGHTTTRNDSAHWRLYLQPILGNGSPKTWKREQFRKIAATLDAKIQTAGLSWKSARNIWATATKMANDAAESKSNKIRCRPDDPAQGVKGPDKGDDIGKQFLYPAEFLKFVQHPDVPTLWKRLVTVAIYSYLRDGELRALECRDVDVEHGVIRVTKAWNRNLKRAASPKGGRAREVPIDPALAPLLRDLLAERGEGPLLDMPSGSNAARALGTWLRAAGVERHELHNATPTTRPIRFHDLRGTGITWRAVRNDPKFELQIDAGHTDFATTEKYLHLASARRRGFGTPFPALPKEVCDHPSDHRFVSDRKRNRIGGEDRIRTGV